MSSPPRPGAGPTGLTAPLPQLRHTPAPGPKKGRELGFTAPQENKQR